MGLKITTLAQEGNKSQLLALYYKNIRGLRRNNYEIYKNRVKLYGKEYSQLNPRFETLAETRLVVLRKMDYLATYEDGIRNGLETGRACKYAWDKQNGPSEGYIQNFYRNAIGYHPDNVVDLVTFCRNKNV